METNLMLCDECTRMVETLLNLKREGVISIPELRNALAKIDHYKNILSLN
jgi:hypothetical protein